MSMFNIHYEIEFYSDWHCGSGMTAGADVDLLVIKDKNGIPFVPGKTIKGLLREAIETINELDTTGADSQELKSVLGHFNRETKIANKGCAFFTNAQLPSELQMEIRTNKLTEYMYRTTSSTAMKDGVADAHSLRKMETTIPCILQGEILNVPQTFIPLLERGMKFVKRLGQNRNRGLGQCSFRIIDQIENTNAKHIVEEKSLETSTISFNCTLLSDIIINQKSATEGKQETLDFIPGSNFLGIAAAIYKELSAEESLYVFHSGKVRFGDAHPSIDGKRSLRIAASMYQPKLLKQEEAGLYIHHEVTDANDDQYKAFQPKQCRFGFYVFENDTIKGVKLNKVFNLKSAYDRNKRRSEDQQMYGYQALESGTSMMFDLCFDSDIPKELIEKVVNALLGKKRVGRSRSAQYGLIDITIASAIAPKEHKIYDTYALVYADARLIFIDQYGQATLQPSATQLGFVNGEIDWAKSQIRSFQYAPWNFQRQARDTDRCGIEKGSVFYIKLEEGATKLEYPTNSIVGSYKNEGFGRVLLNPDFLEAEPNSNGIARYKFVCEEPRVSDKVVALRKELPLINYLVCRKKKVDNESKVYKLVNEFVNNHKGIFANEAFASQWGNIRNYAIQYPDKEILRQNLFSKTKDYEGYIYKGVAKDKWSEKGREKTLVEFYDKLIDDNHQLGLINLAAEMAKISRKE